VLADPAAPHDRSPGVVPPSLPWCDIDGAAPSEQAAQVRLDEEEDGRAGAEAVVRTSPQSGPVACDTPVDDRGRDPGGVRAGGCGDEPGPRYFTSAQNGPDADDTAVPLTDRDGEADEGWHAPAAVRVRAGEGPRSALPQPAPGGGAVNFPGGERPVVATPDRSSGEEPEPLFRHGREPVRLGKTCRLPRLPRPRAGCRGERWSPDGETVARYRSAILKRGPTE
jgi:hypothetical protein